MSSLTLIRKISFCEIISEKISKGTSASSGYDVKGISSDELHSIVLGLKVVERYSGGRIIFREP